MNKEQITIYIFGNPLLDFDNMPIKILPRLKKAFPKINFLPIDPNENLKPKNKKLIIVDTVEGINKVKTLKDLAKIQTSQTYSLHDFDLGLNLKILEKIGELESIIIFCVPQKIEEDDVFNQLKEAIKKET